MKKLVFILFILFLFSINSLSSNELMLEYPYNQSTVQNNLVSFKWKGNDLNKGYLLQIALDSNFQNTILNQYVNSNLVTFSLPLQDTVYYWKVVYLDIAKSSNVYSFTFLKIKNIPNQSLWLSADSGITKNTVNLITNWKDLSPNFFDAYIGTTSSRRPAYIQNINLLNNKPVVRFDGNDDILIYDDFDSLRTAFLVYNHRTGIQSFGTLIGSTTTFDFVGGDNDVMFRRQSVNENLLNGKLFLNKEPILLNDNFHKPIEYSLLSIVTTGNCATNRLATDRVANGRYWNGDLAEIIYYNRPLSDLERKGIENYLHYKYAPPVKIIDRSYTFNSLLDTFHIAVEDRFLDYHWSNDTLTPNTIVGVGDFTIETTDVFGFKTQDCISIYPYKRLGNKTIYICEGESFDLDIQLQQNFTAIWSDNTNGSVIQVDEEGQYTVRIEDVYGNFILDTINILIQAEPKPNKLLNFCLFDDIIFLNNELVESVLWNNTLESKSYPVTTNEEVFYELTTISGCTYKDTFNINIVGQKPSADFNISTTQCKDQAINFEDFSFAPPGDNITNWDWSFGDGNTATSINPINTFNDTLAYLVQLKVTTDKTCTDSIIKTVKINPKPTPNFYNLLSCSGNPTSFIDQSTANADSMSSWNWNFNNLGSATQQNPTFSYPNIGTYQTSLTVTNSNGCYNTISKSTVVNPSPIANFNVLSGCEQTPVTFTNTSSMSNPFVITQWLWSFGDGNQNNTNYNVSHTYQAQGNYNASLVVIANNQCRDTLNTLISIYDNPIVDFNVSPTQCVGSNIQFTDASTTTDGSLLNTWNWFFAGQSTSSQQNPTYSFNTQGNYTIQLNALTEHGCTGTKYKTISVVDKPEVDFSFTPTYGLPPLNVSFVNQSPNTSSFVWDYGDGSSTYSGYNSPNHIYNTIGNYSIKLTAINTLGCTDSVVKYILVDQANIDGVLVNLNVVQNGSYYQVFVTVLNNSNVSIYELGLTIQLQNGSTIREIWTGNLAAGETMTYPFTGQIYYNQNVDLPIICASIESVNINAVETNLENNTNCKGISVGDFDVLSIYPNPTYGNTKFGVMLPEDGAVTIKIVDYLGKVYSQQSFNGFAGYNVFSYDLFPLGSAVYVASIEYDGNIQYQKIMRIDH